MSSPAPSTPREAGRHRRVPPPSRSALLGLLVVLLVLLGGGTALARLAASPAPEPAAQLETVAAPEPSSQPAAAPASPDPGPSASPSPSPTPTEAPPEPEPEPELDREPERESRGRPPTAEPVVDEITAFEDEVTALTNAEREAAGCGEVSTDERLRDAARGHSEDMAANDYFSHTSLDGSSFVDRAQAAGYPSPAGENIAAGYRTPADVVVGWMGSDGHRRNILTCSHVAIGVGLAYDASGQPYWTQVFGR